jgi:hypothetical protein
MTILDQWKKLSRADKIGYLQRAHYLIECGNTGYDENVEELAIKLYRDEMNDNI